MSGKTISTSETRIEAFRLQSSAYGVTIPLVYGVRRIAGNMLWYGGFKAVPHTTSEGGKGGVKVQNTTYTYSASVMMGLCHGRITNIPRAWRGKKLYSGGVTPSQLLTTSESYTPPGSGAMNFTVAQAANFAAIIAVELDIGGSEPWTRTLMRGTDYTVTSGVVTILNDFYRGQALTVRYQYTVGSVSVSALTQLGLTFISGQLGQSAWSGLATFDAKYQIGYSGLACVAGLDYDLGTGAQVENHGFEVVGPMAYHLGSSVPDADPSLVLRDILTNSFAGANFPGAYLDNWSAWSNYCVASSLLVSPGLTQQQRAAEIVERAGELTNTRPVFSGGRLKMVPRADTAVTGNGRTYTPSVTPVYALDDECYQVSNGESPVRVAQKSPADRYNHVRVEYAARALDYNPSIAEAKDQADIDATGIRSQDPLDAKAWLCSDSAARQVAQLVMQRSLHVQNEYTFSLPWHFALLEPADIVTLTDAGLGMSAIGACLTAIEENDAGDLQVTAEDFPAGTGGAAVYPVQVPDGFLHDYNAAPGNADTPIIFEAPVERTRTGLQLYVAVKGAGANWGGAQVWVSQDGTNYRQIGVVYGGARAGTLSANASAGSSTVAVQGLGSAQLVSGSAADATALNTLCYIGGANPEYLAYQTATLTGAGAYTLGGLVHGAYGTGALAHTSGDVFVRVDERVAKSEDLDLSMIGKTVYIKVCSFNIYGGAQQSLADVSATTYTITGVMAAIPPANVAGLTAVAIPGAIRIKWTQNNERDVPGGAIELRRGSVWTSGVRLEDGSAASTNASGNSFDWAWPASGSYTILARHRDALGNLSTATASVSITVTATSIAITGTELSVDLGGGNLLKNASFEADSDADGVPDFWGSTSVGTGVTFAKSRSTTASTIAHGGYSWRLEITALSSPSLATHIHLVPIDDCPGVMAGRVYSLSMYARTNTLSYRARLAVRWLDAADAQIGSADGVNYTFNASGVVERIKIPGLVAPSGAVKARVELGIARPSTGDTTLGVIWFDAAQFQVGDVPTEFGPKPDEILPGTVGTDEVVDDAITEPFEFYDATGVGYSSAS